MSQINSGQTTSGSSASPAAGNPVPLQSARPRRRWWVSLLMSLLIFGSGLGIGGVGAALIIRQRMHHLVHHPEEVPPLLAARWKRQLKLTDQQTEKVLAILRQRQQALQVIRSKTQPQIVAELDQLESEIGPVLNDRQLEKWLAVFREKRILWTPPMPAEESQKSEGRGQK